MTKIKLHKKGKTPCSGNLAVNPLEKTGGAKQSILIHDSQSIVPLTIYNKKNMNSTPG